MSSVEEIEKESDETLMDKANEPLNELQVLFFFFLGPSLITMARAGYYQGAGYKKKYKQAWRYMAFGIVFYTIIIVIKALCFKP